MNKEDLLNNLNFLESHLEKILDSVESTKGSIVYKKDIKESVNSIAIKWFEEIENQVMNFGVSEEIRSKHHIFFDKLLKLSVRDSRKKTYIKTINQILKNIKDELIIPVMKSAGKIVTVSHLSKILDKI